MKKKRKTNRMGKLIRPPQAFEKILLEEIKIKRKGIPQLHSSRRGGGITMLNP